MKRTHIIAIAVGGVVLVLLWFLVLFQPTSKDLSDTKKSVEAAERRELDLDATVRRLEELRRSAPQQQAELRRLTAAVPENPDLAEFILQANEIAATSGIEWLSISPSPPTAGTAGAPSTIAVSMSIQGGFFQVLDYLNRLEDLERLFVVDTLSLSSGASDAAGTGTATAGGSAAPDTSGGPPVLSVSLSGRMFTQAAAPAAAGSAPAPNSISPTTTTTTPSGGSGSDSGNGGTTSTTRGNS